MPSTVNRLLLARPARAVPVTAFVVCPAGLLQALSPEQWSDMRELYRAALAQAREQARANSRPPQVTFSLN